MSKRKELLNVNVTNVSDDALIKTANRLFVYLENGGSTIYLIYLITLTIATATGCMLAVLNTIIGFLAILLLVVVGFYISMKLFVSEEEKMEPYSKKLDEVKGELKARGYEVSVVRVPFGYTYVTHCVNVLDIKKKK